MKWLVALLTLWMALFALDATAQQRPAPPYKFPGADSAEKVHSNTRATISAGTTAPFYFLVLAGEGAPFSHVKASDTGFIVKLTVASETSQSPIEEMRVTRVSGDTLFVSQRGVENTSPRTWQQGAYVGVVFSGEYIGSLQRAINDLIPAVSGQSGKILSNNGGHTTWIAVPSVSDTGTVASVGLSGGGTGLTVTGSPVTSTGTMTLAGAVNATHGGLGLTGATLGTLPYATGTNVYTSTALGTGLTYGGGAISVTLSPFTTTTLAEGANLYYTAARFNSAFTAKTTDALAEGSTNLYYTDGRADARIALQKGAADGIASLDGTGKVPLSQINTIDIAHGGTNATTKIQAEINLFPDTTGNSGKYVRYDGAHNPIFFLDTAGSSGGGGGGVTSVNVSGGTTGLTTSGGPITTSGTITVAGDLIVANGGTGVTTIPNHGAMVGAGTGAITTVAPGTSGNLFTSNGTSWTSAAPATNGTVTSVGITGPSIITWSNTPVTTNGTLTGVLASQSQNLGLFSPDGSSGAPAFRALVVADLPTGIPNANLANSSITIQGSAVSLGGATLATNSSPTFASMTLANTTNQLTLGVTNTTTISATAPAASRVYTMPDVLADASFVMTQGNQTLSGQKTFGTTIVGSITGNSGTVTNGVYTIGTNTLTGLQNLKKDNIKTTYTTALDLENTTASDATNTVQQSPSLLFDAHGWSTAATAADSELVIRITDVPVTAANATSKLNIDFGNASLGFTNEFSLTSGGAGTFVGALTASNLSGTNTGDQTITLTGNVTGSGTGSFATTIANLAVTNAMIAAATIDLAAKVTGTLPVANGGIGAATLAVNGVLYGNTTSAVQALAVNSSATNKFLTQSSSNAPVWATIVAGDVPTLNQNTTGSAATLTTARGIYGNNFDGSAALTQIIASTYGGTGNGFAKLSGPASSEKTYTLPNASATILTDNAAVTVAQGGTGLATLPAHAVLTGNGTSTVTSVAPGTNLNVLQSNGTDWVSAALTSMTNPMTTTGDMVYSSSGSTPARLAAGTIAQALIGGSSAPAWGATITNNAIGASSTDGWVLTNTTAAANGTQQYSPRLRLTGQGWKTNATAATETVDWIVENRPVQGTSVPASQLVFAEQTNAAGYNDVLTLAPLNSQGNNEMYVGSSGATVQDVYFGYGKSGGGGTTSTLHASNGTGSNNPGAALALSAGLGTGTQLSGELDFIGSFVGSTGSSLNSTRTLMKLVPSGTAASTAKATLTLGIGSTADGNLAIANVTNGNLYTIVPAAPSGSRTLTIQDPGAAADLLFETAALNSAYVALATGTRGVLSDAKSTTAKFGSNVTFDASSSRTISIAAATSNPGDALTMQAGNANGTDNGGGTLYLDAGRGTGAGAGGDVGFYTSLAGTTGTTLRSSFEAAFITPFNGTSTIQLGLGSPNNAKGQIVLYDDAAGSTAITIDPTAGANYTATIRDVGGAADFLMSTTNLSTANQTVMTTSTRGNLTSAGPNTTDVNPGNPAGTSSATSKMMGLAGVSITPATTGRILIMMTGDLNSGATGNPVVQICYGTGSAPANGDAATGTAVGSALQETGLASGSVPFSAVAIVSSLTVSTAYWIDAKLKSDGTSTATITNVHVSVQEIK